MPRRPPDLIQIPRSAQLSNLLQGAWAKRIPFVLSHHLQSLGIYLTARSRYHEAYLKRHRVFVECTISITDDYSHIVQISDLRTFDHKVTT